MSIDAKIRQVEETPEGLLLHLEPRYKHGWSIMGQRTLLIEQATWRPEPGMAIWGGHSIVTIETSSHSKQYQRRGYTRLIEEKSNESVCHVQSGEIS
jgi:hypothetical protein